MPESLGKSEMKSVAILSVKGGKLDVASISNVKPLSAEASVSGDPVVGVDVDDEERLFTS